MQLHATVEVSEQLEEEDENENDEENLNDGIPVETIEDEGDRVMPRSERVTEKNMEDTSQRKSVPQRQSVGTSQERIS